MPGPNLHGTFVTLEFWIFVLLIVVLGRCKILFLVRDMTRIASDYK